MNTTKAIRWTALSTSAAFTLHFALEGDWILAIVCGLPVALAVLLSREPAG